MMVSESFFPNMLSWNRTIFSIHCVFVLYIFFLKFPLITIFCYQWMNMAATCFRNVLYGRQVLIQYLIHEIIITCWDSMWTFLRKHAMKLCVFLSLPFVYSPILCYLSETMWWILKSKCYTFAWATGVRRGSSDLLWVDGRPFYFLCPLEGYAKV